MEHPSVSRQSTADAHPLLVFFDIETTGLSIYNECITEIAAKVVGDPVSTVTKAVYTSLVHATKSIPPEGRSYQMKDGSTHDKCPQFKS